MPRPDDKLRALYLGDVRPDLILNNVVRFSLYTDEILIVDPFGLARSRQPAYNPILNPDQYKSDTVQLVYVLYQLAPWIISGIVKLIPDPHDFIPGLRWTTAEMAKSRFGEDDVEQSDIDAAKERGKMDFMRAMYALPDAQIKKVLRDSHQVYSESELASMIRHIRHLVRHDPLSWEGSYADHPQLNPIRSGANLETALLISDLSGAFPYTNLATRWREITKAHEELNATSRVWTPLTQAFQTLQFRFLNNVDVPFAQRVREDGRLNTLRSFLRRIGKDAEGLSEISAIEAYVRDCKDELIGEYRKAEAEWDRIDEAFLKWVAGAAAGGAALAGGHLTPSLGAWSGATLTGVSQLYFRYLSRQRFRKANPMSVFVDLRNRKS